MSVTMIRIPKSDVEEYLASILGEGLRKDLHHNEDYTEEVCRKCHGTGIVISENPYGLSEENEKPFSPHRDRFPYRHQSIGFCPDCSNGVVKRCAHCGELLPRYMLKCKCRKPYEEKIAEEQHREKIKNLPWATPEQSEQEMYYSPAYPYNEGYFETFDDFFDAWEDDHDPEDDPEDERPEYCFPTNKYILHLDMTDIIENACSDLYDEAFDNVSHIDELQEAADKWVAEHGPGGSYSYYEGYKIRIPWENR